MKHSSLKSDDFMDLATFHGQSKANALKSALESAGIQAQLRDERKLQRFWFMAPPKAGIHVQVPRDAFERAVNVLKKHDFGAHAAIHCPSCDSTRVQYPALTRKNLLPALAGWMLTVLHLTEHKYYCEDCHFTWPQPKASTRPTAILR